MESLVLVLMAVVVGVLIYTIIRLSRSDYSLLANRMAGKTRERLEVLRPCPLCRSMLRRGETVHTVVFSGTPGGIPTAGGPGVSGGSAGSARDSRAAGDSRRGESRPRDSITHMFGCPYCHPSNPEHPRVCPVCHQELPPDGYIIARLFEKPGKKHVHVLGCTECRKAHSRDTTRSIAT